MQAPLGTGWYAPEGMGHRYYRIPRDNSGHWQDGHHWIYKTAAVQKQFYAGNDCTVCHFISCSGDGTMGVFNIRRRRFELLSEPQNGDLTAVSLVKVSATAH